MLPTRILSPLDILGCRIQPFFINSIKKLSRSTSSKTNFDTELLEIYISVIFFDKLEIFFLSSLFWSSFNSFLNSRILVFNCSSLELLTMKSCCKYSSSKTIALTLSSKEKGLSPDSFLLIIPFSSKLCFSSASTVLSFII